MRQFLRVRPRPRAINCRNLTTLNGDNNKMANAENNTPNNFSERLRAETEKQRANAKANYFVEIYAQTGAKTIVLLSGAKQALAKQHHFEPLPRVSNKNIELFELYIQACAENDKCIRGTDRIK